MVGSVPEGHLVVALHDVFPGVAVTSVHIFHSISRSLYMDILPVDLSVSRHPLGVAVVGSAESLGNCEDSEADLKVLLVSWRLEVGTIHIHSPGS